MALTAASDPLVPALFPAAIGASLVPHTRFEIRIRDARREEFPPMSDSMSMSTHSAPPVSANEIPELARETTPVWPASPARLYMTSDLRAATGLPRTHMDYYLREGLIVPTTRSESGYLLFDEKELATLRSIIADRAAGVPLRVIRRRLGR